MILVFSLISLSSAGDFNQLNKLPGESFILLNDISIQISKESLVNQFSGALSGARRNIKFTNMKGGYLFIESLSGSISNIVILVESDLENSFMLIQKLQGALIYDCQFRIQSDSISHNADITYFESIVNSQFLRCKYTCSCHTIVNKYKVFGISSTIDSLTAKSLEVELLITNAVQVIGLCKILNSQFPVSVSFNVFDIEELYGIAISSPAALKDIQISISGRETGLIYGIAETVVSIQQFYLYIQMSYNKPASAAQVFGICRQMQGNLKQLQISINIASFSITQAKIHQLAYNIKEKSQISNIAIQSSYSALENPLEVILLSESNAQNIEILFISINATIKLDQCGLLKVAYFNGDLENVQLSMANFNLTISGGSKGMVQSLGIGQKIINSQFTNISLIQDIRLSKLLSVIQYYPVGQQVNNLQITNASFCNSIFIDYGVETEKSYIHGVAKAIARSQLQNIIVQNLIQIRNLVINEFQGLSDSINEIHVSFLVLCGSVSIAEKTSISGISKTGQNSEFNDVLINFLINSPQSSSCNILFENAVSNTLTNIVDQIFSTRCAGESTYTSDTSNTMTNIFIMSGTGKQNVVYTVSQSKMSSSSDMAVLLASNNWVIDTTNNKMIHLKNFFTVSSSGDVEDVVAEIPPFTQQRILFSSIINIKNPENLCFDRCQGIFDGNSLICNVEFSGQLCQEFVCPIDFCQDGAKCHQSNGCECPQGKTGTQCEIDNCEFCFGGPNKCEEIQNVLTCKNDQSANCYHGNVTNNLCVCSSGYESINTICDTFECKNSLDCNGGLCINGMCHCSSITGGISCQFCNIRGQLGCKTTCLKDSCANGASCVYLSGAAGDWECSVCDFGWKAPFCSECIDGFRKDGNTCIKKCDECLAGDCYFTELCTGPVEDCDIKCFSCNLGILGIKCDMCPAGEHIYQYKCYALEDEKVTNGVCIKVGGSLICLSCSQNYILINDLCVFQCLPSNCINGDCQPDQTCVCRRYALGKYCDSCQPGTGSFLGQCLMLCNTCNGDCYYENDDIICSSCNDNFQGMSCQGCWEGYINIGTQCLEICQKCHGDRCYIDEIGNYKCLGFCDEGYISDGCFTCDNVNGYENALDGCYKPCNTCPEGTCFHTFQGILCSTCNGGLTGQQCNICLEGFVFAKSSCRKQVTEDDCYLDSTGTVVCVSCIPGKILVNQKCMIRCVLPECAGECFQDGLSYFCDSCFPQFIHHERKCYPQVINPNGSCFQLNNVLICDCYRGYTGPTCGECKELEQDGSCYYRNDISTGICYNNAAIPLDTFCKKCQYNYAMPLCVNCAWGYDLDIKNQCSVCYVGFISSNTLPLNEKAIIGADKCLMKCQSCIQGNCFYTGDTIQCGACQAGYNIAGNCFQCQDEFVIYGRYCLRAESDSCGKENSGEDYCHTCGPLHESFNCSKCSVEDTFGTECKQHAVIFPGDCYQDASIATCTDRTCLSYDLSQHQCIICQPDRQNILGQCAKNTIPQNDIFRGSCVSIQDTFQCQACQAGWSGVFCQNCAKGFITCECGTESFKRCCCPLLTDENGVCFKSQLGEVLCDYCGSNYKLVSQKCIKLESGTGRLLLMIILPMVICFFLLLILVFAINISRSKKRRIKAYIKRITKRIGTHLLFVLLSQALAIIIAIQDVYIDNFFMQISVNIFSMIPFLLTLFLFAAPTYRRFFYNLPSHFFLFILSAMLELSFHFVQYQAVTEVSQDFGEQIYKLASPLVTLFMCIFLAGFRFKSQQKLAVFIAIALPIFAQVMYAIQDSQASGYFSKSSAWNIIFGQMMVNLAILLNGAQFYLFDLILGKYGEIGAIGRLSLASFLVNTTVGLLNPGEIINSILQYDIFFSSLGTQIFFNVINVVVMMHISAVEFGINLISSAIWAQFITAVGDYQIARNNSYAISPLAIILQSIALVIVFFSLLYFNMRSSYWDHRDNTKLSEVQTSQTGVRRFFESRKEHKKFFGNAARSSQYSKFVPTTNYQRLKQLQVNQLQAKPGNQYSSTDQLSPLTIPKQTEDYITELSPKQVLYIKQFDTCVTKLPPKHRGIAVPKLQLASEKILSIQAKSDPNFRATYSLQQLE
ncbi:Transmembrane domain-containing protein [Spironucleus salmonicida]|uniref:Transmembrane domain-containing protein n=2 Tax=Spironucleus salmonicida TaxID=348837 RepID=A0A9P8LKH6_9EUKA|nr:Transmembrane domain-containing protein [Spironucleus salmonicida]